ncbi:MAG: M14 family zinc carboxypeptidase [Planctomycetota bacterium]|jgi:carboxypeptidase D
MKAQWLHVSVCLLLLAGLPVYAQVDPSSDFPRPIEVRFIDLESAELIDLVREMNLDIEGPHIYLRPWQYEDLKGRGFSMEIIPHPLDDDPYLIAGWPTFAELTAELEDIANDNPDLCRLFNIGNSVQGRELWFMKISDNVDAEEDEPEFKYISSMHGDEVTGMALCLNLIHLLVDDYGIDPQITNLVDEVEIWIMPLMNPDGYTNGSRYNAHGKDLNRDFPDRVADPVNTTAGRATETKRVMNWGFAHHPALSANFHGGALVVNYPYDSDPDPWAHYSATPDDDLFIAQSLVYSSLNPPMYNSSWFPQGITNGIAWYLIYGGMQDWNYVWMGCNDVTIEVSSNKWPSYSQIPQYWDDNRDAMLAYMEECLKGVRGIVTNSVTGQPLDSVVEVQGRDHEVNTDPDAGDYHRMLLPGNYTLRFSAYGFLQKDVPDVSVTSGPATRLDVGLIPEGSLISDKPEITTAGGPVNFTLMAGSGNASRNYLLLGSVSGTSPGYPLPGGLVTLPLNWDDFLVMVLTMINTPVFDDFMGKLDTGGNAAAQLNVPHLPPTAAGVVMYFAFTLNNPFDFVSDTVEIKILL